MSSSPLTQLDGSVSADSDILLRAQDVSISYPTAETNDRGVVAVANADFSLLRSAFTSMIGPSGCGKSSLLNAIAGVISHSTGSLTLGDKDIRGPGRERAMVFQTASLLPWRSLIANVMFGAELQGLWGKREMRTRASALIELVGLGGKEGLYPHQLSGGMQQRANLARALMVEPALLLLDEPFAALDQYTRDSMQIELERIVHETRSTVLLVTHQISEAVYLSDRIIVMGSTPGRVITTFDVDQPHPRDSSWRKSDHARRIADNFAELLAPPDKEGAAELGGDRADAGREQ